MNTEDGESVPSVSSAVSEVDADARRKRRRFRYTLPGATISLIFVCLSFTPSLLPRATIPVVGSPA